LDRFFRSALFPLIVIVLLVYLASQTLFGDEGSEKTVSYAEVQHVVRSVPDRVKTVTFKPGIREVVVELDNGSKLRATYPTAQAKRALERLIVTKSGSGDTKNDGSSAWWTILTSLLPFILLFAFWIFLTGRMQRNKRNEDIAHDVTNT
jgi:cell division protease FtsH